MVLQRDLCWALVIGLGVRLFLETRPEEDRATSAVDERGVKLAKRPQIY